MSQLPPGKYQVSLITNTWADGELDTTVTPPTYTSAAANNGKANVSNWRSSADGVGWRIPLTAPGSNQAYPIAFSHGHYRQGQQPAIQRGRANGFPQGPRDDPEDNWTATAGSGMEAGTPEVV
jgi:hypothetical protein